MAKGMWMQNGRIKYAVIKEYALDTVSKFTAEEMRNSLPYAYGLIEEIRKTYYQNNGNGQKDKLNGVFEKELEFLYNQGIDQLKKLSLLIILDRDHVVRRVACFFLFGVANKIVNSEKAQPIEKLQLANDIFHFFIDYINDIKNTQNSTENLINDPIVDFISNHMDLYRSLILTLVKLYPNQLENPVTEEEYKSALSILLLEPSA